MNDITMVISQYLEFYMMRLLYLPEKIWDEREKNHVGREKRGGFLYHSA